ncbi:hypothetical protein [Spirosoma pollinicola]|uniref:Outer membrane protein beta-barrel domain-containing protein n=1 Tax=Spirosoma pollinicola TaxID=2057025 RepID=A0A2K8YY55_9BACT|nr:hypothetical protein [Spirosoma pollinicola]AUD02552.1 hypothetical protein CWM47_12345 [Spirosoma pollinicola]
MRKLFVIMLVMVSVVANAQTAAPATPTKPAKSTKSNKPLFKMTLAGGYASPLNTGENGFAKAGVVYSIEPQFELSKNLEVGLRFEQAFIQRSEALKNDIYYASKAKSIMSGAVTANYVISTSTGLKPFVGLGAGLYYADASSQTFQSSGNPSVTYPLPTTFAVGGLGRVGVKYKILHLEAAYNLVSNTSVKNAATGLTLKADNSYLSLKAGITIGGTH